MENTNLEKDDIFDENEKLKLVKSKRNLNH